MLILNNKFNLTRFITNLFKRKEPNHLSNFSKWIKVCDEILSSIYPPLSSSFEITEDELERDSKLDFSTFKNWQLVCEEILDTEHSHIYYQKCYNELLIRGKSEDEIFKMRKFAWLTAGWLNYEQMFWEWIELDEKDIKMAIEFQYSSSIINLNKRNELLDFLELHK
ncbi:hypothetical protein EHQ24_06685 [Leptospira noumeaensis]|uniref:Uncharacterized protein n=1 Tax=Leptospira noumeaensis TaxID=2484964 RepID=A0A4R9IA94_9LEPT|nr:hypothetical protein [Leptospira noumeaensis]TGK83284.1 hypothetical protein EHQ24_06685 [Leptospira noumeaensis]